MNQGGKKSRLRIKKKTVNGARKMKEQNGKRRRSKEDEVRRKKQIG